MGKAIVTGFGIVIVAIIGLAGYGYLVDMAPAPQPQSQNVVLNAR